MALSAIYFILFLGGRRGNLALAKFVIRRLDILVASRKKGISFRQKTSETTEMTFAESKYIFCSVQNDQYVQTQMAFKPFGRDF